MREAEGGGWGGQKGEVLTLNVGEGSWRRGDQPGVLGPADSNARPPILPLSHGGGAREGQDAAGAPLTFTFMRSSQKLRGGSTMVVLSSMT